MLQTAYIRENKEKVLEGLAKRNFDDAAVMIERVLELDDARRSTQNALDTTLSQQNALAKEIGDMFKSGRGSEAAALKEKTAALKSSSKELEEKLAVSRATLPHSKRTL